MATLDTDVISVLDAAKRTDPDGSIALVAEVLEQTNPILQDLPLVEGNLPAGHQSTRRSTLPTGNGFRRRNAGSTPRKSTTEQVQDQTAILEKWFQMEERGAALYGDRWPAFRMSEAKAFIEAMGQDAADAIFYGNAYVSDIQLHGLAPRLTTAHPNVIDAGGASTDNTSIYVVCFSPDTIHGITPKGSASGLVHRAFDLDVINDFGGVAGAQATGYQDQFVWEFGLHVRDPRYMGRIGSIDVSDLRGSTPIELTPMISSLLWGLPSTEKYPITIYCNRTVGAALDRERRDKVADGGQLSYEVVDGKRIDFFRNARIRVTDAITNAETAI